MGGFRALTRHTNTSALSKQRQDRKRTYQEKTKDEDKAIDKRKLKLISLSAEQESSKSVPFVFDSLPTTKAALDALF